MKRPWVLLQMKRTARPCYVPSTQSRPSASLLTAICAVATLAISAFLPSNAAPSSEHPTTFAQQAPILSQPQSAASPSGAALEIPRSQAARPSGDILEIPPLEVPILPPAPLPLQSVTIPAGLVGCWEGDPGGFDQVHTDSLLRNIGSPGKIVFCYHDRSIDVREVEIRVSPVARAYDVTLSMGLSYTTFTARGVETDVFLVTPDTLRTRSLLDVVATAHLFWLIPLHQHQGMVEDEVVKLSGLNRVSVKARFLYTSPAMKMWGTWHADFHRVSDPAIPLN